MNKIFLLLIFLITNSYAGRMYSSEYGRWVNRDPVGVSGGINLYNSVSNDMVNGFSGGLSIAGGMNLFNNYVESYKVDPFGFKEKTKFVSSLIRRINLDDIEDHNYYSVSRPKKFTSRVHSFKRSYAGDISFTLAPIKHEYALGRSRAGLKLEGGFKLRKGLKESIEYECDELRWVQVFQSNYWHDGTSWGFGNYSQLDPALPLSTGIPKKDENNKQELGFDDQPFYFGGIKETFLKKNGYDLYFEDSPKRSWSSITYNSRDVRWSAELCMVARTKSTGKIEFIKCFKYGFLMSKLFDGSGNTKASILSLSPSQIIDLGDSPSNSFIKAVRGSKLVK
ncbi:MAG: hypothetical protein NE330_08300 [Lentisphaeraceae bacterium]|nr:hypothetical protein [Lentisphaeraceae bacterium]